MTARRRARIGDRSAAGAAGLGLCCMLLVTRVFADDTAAAGPAPERAPFAGAVASASAMPRLHSLLVSRDGELVLERYFNGASATRPANVKSVSKSIISALVGIAIDEGHLGGLDQPIGEFLADRLDSDPTGRKREITIGNLLSMQAGLETTSFYNYGAWVQSGDWVGFALDQPLVAMPGTRMVYSTGNTHLLSAILTEATGRSTYRYARESLALPLGIELSPWPTDPQGIYFGGNNMELTPRQMLAFGELYLNEGRANGRPIVPASWVERSLRPRVQSRRDRERYYGYGWWSREMAGVDTAYAWGFGGQFILLAPELELVVVTTSSSLPGDTRRRHTRALYDLIEHDVIEAEKRHRARAVARADD